MTVVKIHTWIADRGFGFVDIDGQKHFIHVNAIKPNPPYKADLQGEKLEILETIRGNKGMKVVSAHRVITHEWEIDEEREVLIFKSFAGDDIEYDPSSPAWTAPNSQVWETRPPHIVEWVDKTVSKAKAERESIRKWIDAEVEKVLSSGEVQKHLPLDWTQEVDLGNEISLKLFAFSEIEVSEINPVNGVIITYDQSLRFTHKPSYQSVDRSHFKGKVTVGWEGVTFAANFFNMFDREAGELIVEFKTPNGAKGKARYSAFPRPPRIEGDKVKQIIAAETPIGEAYYDMVIHQNPDNGWGRKHREDGAWQYQEEGNKLIAELNRRVIVAKGISFTEMPKVLVEPSNYTITVQGGGRWESEDGYMAGGRSWQARVDRGGMRIYVESKLLGQLVSGNEDSTGASFRISGFDTEVLKKGIQDHIEFLVSKINIRGFDMEAYTRKLIDHILSHLPEFNQMSDLWLVDDARSVSDLPHGKVVVSGTYTTGRLQGYHYSHVKTVVKKEVAEQHDISGELLEGPVKVYWP